MQSQAERNSEKNRENHPARENNQGESTMNFGNAWLNYQENLSAEAGRFFQGIYSNTEEAAAGTAIAELQAAAKKIFHIEMRRTGREEATISLLAAAQSSLGEGYTICETSGHITITSGTARGLLYGGFALIRQIQTGRPAAQINLTEKPSNPLRILNHWDNMDGSIERGYSGNSFFFAENRIVVNERTRAYARLCASVGVNTVVINNVNVRAQANRLLEEEHRENLAALARVFQAYGIDLYISLNFALPVITGGLHTADPLDETVRVWWKKTLGNAMREIPNLRGFLVKADSEGEPGPFTYGRTHCDGANMLADAVAENGGKIIWRCFVYNCQQDWRDTNTDRARSGYDHFIYLDGKFRENVMLQIKNGPMDFQVREPVSPLFGGLQNTNQILEVQIAQEYTGQQRHVCYLVPMFKEILAFRTHCKLENDTVADIVSGKTFGQSLCGMAAVCNTGSDENWTGHDLAAANWYGFCRLSFQTTRSAEEIAEEWICCTFGNNPKLVRGIRKLLMMSWPAYEKYTSPLGIGWLVNPGHHYGPNVEGYEYDRWGTYHRANHLGIGVDRSSKGTGFATLYHRENAALYETVETCPEELLLFFHRLPYLQKLKSGKTLIQHIYDSHFEGAEEAEQMAALWDALEEELPEKVYAGVRQRFAHQLEHSKEWRDRINTYFHRISAIEDAKGRKIY